MQKLLKICDMIKTNTKSHPTKIEMCGLGSWNHNSWRIDWDGNEYHIRTGQVFVGDTVIKFYSNCIIANGNKYPVSWRSLQKVINDIAANKAA